MNSINIATLVLVASLFLSLLSGLNQIAGFFSRISLLTDYSYVDFGALAEDIFAAFLILFAC